MSGETVNVTENRPALHTALRLKNEGSLFVKVQNVMTAILDQRAKMSKIVDKIQQKKWFGATNEAITDVVNLGIGGSDLGPKMAVQALKNYQQSTIKVHFISNVDPDAISSLLEIVNPATTLLFFLLNRLPQ